jgi:hypothetical protein
MILADAASLLLGERWQRPLARLLDVDDRLVRRWAAGERPVPDWVLERLATELKARRAAIDAALRGELSPLRILEPPRLRSRTPEGGKEQG